MASLTDAFPKRSPHSQEYHNGLRRQVLAGSDGDRAVWNRLLQTELSLRRVAWLAFPAVFLVLADVSQRLKPAPPHCGRKEAVLEARLRADRLPIYADVEIRDIDVAIDVKIYRLTVFYKR